MSEAIDRRNSKRQKPDSSIFRPGMMKAIRAFCVSLAVSGMLALPAATARADETQYLADLHSPGMAHPALPDSGLVAIGNDVCGQVRGGATSTAARDWLVDHLAHGGYQASNAEAGTVVHFALQDLCPGITS